MGDIGPVRRHFEVLPGADLLGPSLERVAQLAQRAPSAPQGAAQPGSAGSVDSADRPDRDLLQRRDDTPAG